MKSNVYMMLEEFFDDTMINIAKKMGYSEDNILILEDNIDKLKTDYSDVYDNLKSCKHNRDSRTEIEYAQDLICSWIFEDYLILNLKLYGLEVKLCGTDHERKILQSSLVSSKSDMFVKGSNNNKIYIELVNDYRGYWLKYSKIDLRDDKYLHIKSLSKGVDKSFLLGVDFYNKKFFLFDVNKNQNVKYEAFHYAYKKPVYTISLKNIVYYDFSFEKICNEIKKELDGDNNEKQNWNRKKI